MKFLKNEFNRIRSEKNLDLTAIANQMNITTKAVHKWSVGQTSPRMNRIEILADVLQCDVSEIIEIQPSKSTTQRHIVNSALEIQNMLNDVIITLAMDSDCVSAIKQCAEIIQKVESDLL